MKTIKGKYRELIKKYHPDQTKGKTRQQFELIQTAYEKIKVERQNYKDENGEEKEITPFSKQEVDEILKAYGVKIKNGNFRRYIKPI